MHNHKVEIFKQSKFLSVDIETRDPLLVDLGPGTFRGDGHICGISLSTEFQGKIVSDYFSLTHPDTPEEARKYNRGVLTEILAMDMPKIGANIVYDMEWCDHEGMPIAGKTHDVQFAEPLLNENRRKYNLDSLAKYYHLDHKKSNVLSDYNKHMGWKGRPIANIWRMPESVAAEYAMHDTTLPLQIFEKQKRHLETQNLWDLYMLETDLIPVLLMMRKNGVRLDVPLLKRTIRDVTEIHFRLEQEINEWAGRELNINSPAQLAAVFDFHKIPYPRNPLTPKMKAKGLTVGNPNIDKNVLFDLAPKYPICKKLLDYRHYGTLINLSLHNYSKMLVGDRIHCTFHPLRSDKYGTVSGRFSSSKPNLQQVSAKDEEVDETAGLSTLQGQILRKLFIPEDDCRWNKKDYSQIEYRIMAHYANGNGNKEIDILAEQLRETYRQDKNTDYHQRIMDITGFDRRTAKNVNFGGMYGIGVPSSSKLFRWSIEKAKEILDVYHREAPYIRTTRQSVTNVAASRGYLYTILNRRARTHVSRKLHSMFNRLIQGGAADIMKKAIVDCYKAGIFDVLKLHITVHDELDTSNPKTKEAEEASKEMDHLMETAVPLKVPVLVDSHTGANWAEAD